MKYTKRFHRTISDAQEKITIGGKNYHNGCAPSEERTGRKESVLYLIGCLPFGHRLSWIKHVVA